MLVCGRTKIYDLRGAGYAWREGPAGGIIPGEDLMRK